MGLKETGGLPPESEFELRATTTDVSGLLEGNILRPAATEPKKPRVGAMVIAETSWDPLSLGARYPVYWDGVDWLPVSGLVSVPGYDELDALTPSDGQVAYMTSPDLLGVWVYDAAATETVNNGTIRNGPEGVGRWKRLYDGPIYITWFGATQSGDSSSALSSAASAAGVGGRVYFPPGSWTVGNVNLSTDRLLLFGPGVLEAKSGADGLTLSGDYMTVKLDMDLGGLNATNEQYSGLVLAGDHCNYRGEVWDLTCNTSSATGVCAGVYVTGQYASVDVVGRDFVRNTGAGNGSFPRLVAVAGDDCRVAADCFKGNVGIVISGDAARTRITRAQFKEMDDNGVYNLSGVDTFCDFFSYDGNEEAWVEAGTRTFVAALGVTIQGSSGAPLGLQDATDLTVGRLYVVDAASSIGPGIIRTRSGNTTSSNIRILGGYVVSKADIPIALTTGTVNGLFMQDILWEHHFVNTGQQKKIIDWTTGDLWHCRDVHFRIYDDTGTLGSGTYFTASIPTFTAPSMIDNFQIECPDGDYGFRMSKVEQANLAIRGGDLEGNTGPYYRESRPNGYFRRKVLFAAGSPSAGTWPDETEIRNTATGTGSVRVWVYDSTGSAWRQDILDT